MNCGAAIFTDSLRTLWQTINEDGQSLSATVDNVLLLGRQNPLVASVLLLAFYIVISWLLGVATDNYSWVDRLWSITPVTYVYIFASTTPPPPTSNSAVYWRLWLIFGLVLLWGCRLTFNFYRKGGYRFSNEDYRWRYVMQFAPNWFVWQIFNLIVISIYQHVLLWSLTLPVYYILTATALAPFGWKDYAVACLYLALLALETAADEQQWYFHRLKHRKPSRLTVSEETLVQQGFLSTGLFRFSRHPNFFAEISMWFTIYLFSVVSRIGTDATADATVANCTIWTQWVNYSLLGPVALLLLFQGSTTLTERITAGKYPGYKSYQQTTSRLIPWFPNPAPSTRSSFASTRYSLRSTPKKLR